MGERGTHRDNTKNKGPYKQILFLFTKTLRLQEAEEKKGFGHDEYEVENTSSRPFQERDNSRVNSQ